MEWDGVSQNSQSKACFIMQVTRCQCNIMMRMILWAFIDLNKIAILVTFQFLSVE